MAMGTDAIDDGLSLYRKSIDQLSFSLIFDGVIVTIGRHRSSTPACALSISCIYRYQFNRKMVSLDFSLFPKKKKKKKKSSLMLVLIFISLATKHKTKSRVLSSPWSFSFILKSSLVYLKCEIIDLLHAWINS
jgi:hypothetical protein